MDLRESVLEWDCKSVDQIADIYARFSKDSEFASEAVSLFADENTQIGATWLFKKHLELKHSIDQDVSSLFWNSLNLLASWEAKLHILQCFPFLSVSFVEKESAEIFLRKCLSEKNKFVRAWAFGGFYELANQHPEYRKEAKRLIEYANETESASVKARIRNVVKNGFMTEKK